MTGPEQAQVAALRRDLMEEIAGLRRDVAPAILLAANLALFGRALAETGRFLKWGVGVGAGLATMFLALHAAGVL